MELINEVLILAILIIFQSIFGVGLLLFGTPTFLYFDYSFSETLYLLLPLSFVISLIQFTKSKQKEKSFINSFNKFTVPSLIVSLVIILLFQELINLKIFISIMLISFSLISFDKKIFKKFILRNSYKNIFFILLGTIHGLTNLGGGFLALYSNIIVKKNKDLTRYYISYGYLVMVSVQLLVLFIMQSKDFNYNNLLYILLVLTLYFPTQILYKKIDQLKFANIIRIIAIFYGLFILINSWSSS